MYLVDFVFRSLFDGLVCIVDGESQLLNGNQSVIGANLRTSDEGISRNWRKLNCIVKAFHSLCVIVEFQVAVGHRHEESDNEVGAHFDFAFVISKVLLFDNHVFIKDRFEVHGLEEVLVAGLVGEFNPLENSQNLLVILQSFEIVTLLVEFVSLFFVLVEVEEKAREWLLSELFQIFWMEESMLKACWKTIEELALGSEFASGHATFVIKEEGPARLVKTFVAILKFLFVERIEIFSAHYRARTATVGHLGHALEESLRIVFKLFLEVHSGHATSHTHGTALLATRRRLFAVHHRALPRGCCATTSPA